MADAPGTQLRPLRPRYPIRTERLLLRPLTAGDDLLAEEWYQRTRR
jgi:hypothetical protein